MDAISPEQDERLSHYLIRCRDLARHSWKPVACAFEGIAFTITPDMSPTGVVDAYFSERVVKDALKKDTA